MGIWDKFYEHAKSFFADDGEGGTQPRSRCHYDLLEVSREATEEEIKRSFKRLALRWHPDKNPERAEECTAYFVLIQQAYEVLIDPQERAFYDRHRENIIYQRQTEDGLIVDERRDTGINLEPFMSTSCFCGSAFGRFASSSNSGATDGEEDKFFAVYRDLFHKLAAEEYAYIEDPEERNFPVFGKATSDYDTVAAPFYAFWLDFSTQRSFAWLDKWDLRQAPDRPTARVMEKENRKMREQGRKQRSEQVRKVVEFVRKNDARVQLAKERQRERNARIHQIVEEQRLQTIRRNLEKMPTFERDEEAHQRHLAHLEDIEQALDAEFGTIDAAELSGQHSGEEGEADDENAGKFRCIVCEKNFNSKNVLVNHQRSKKHRQMVELLRVHMREEDQQLLLVDDEAAEKNGGEGGRKQQEEQETDDNEGSGGGGQQQQRRRGKRQRKRRAAKRAEDKTEAQEEGAEEKSKEETTRDDEDEGMVEGAERTAEEKEESGEKENKLKGGVAAATATTKKGEENKATRQKKGAGNGEQEQQSQPKGPMACECTTCGAEFESKTKLHAHLRDSGHATLRTMATKKPAESTADAGRRRRKKKEAN
uniref:DnaJ domain-containing protein n=1 Tax=Globodera pallida TaxID=36090 RepID=A0A183CFF6_GLOPA